MCRVRTEEEKMQSPCIGEASACFHGCCLNPFLGLPEPQSSTTNSTTTSRYAFSASTTSSLYPNAQFTNHESLPSMAELFSNFTKAYPLYLQTYQADQIRSREYYHLSLSNHVCLDYIGHGLFSYFQQQSHYTAASIASTSSSPPPSLNFTTSNVPFFNILNKSVNLYSQILYGGQESTFDSIIRKRIMSFMNISEDDYSMVFTANQSSAFKLLADSYPFQSNRELLTVYDHDNEAVETMIDWSKKKGAREMSAEFSWPKMRIRSKKLRKIVESKRKNRKRGLFVFPLQSKMTGARYSYLWMSIAQENGWHVLLDASALGAKDMETLGLSLFKPDFLFCSFYKIFGENPSGFGCLFVKKSSASVLNNYTTKSIGIVSLLPVTRPCHFLEKPSDSDLETEQQSSISESKKDGLAVPSSSSSSVSVQQIEKTYKSREILEPKEKQKQVSVSEIVELDNPHKTGQSGIKEASGSEIEFRGLDHADSLGLILISSRARYLVNWLVNALKSLQHPHSENALPLVTIYGPKVRFDRGPAMAFNMFDWKGEKVNPALVQKLADRNNISLSCGFLKNICFSDKHDAERNLTPEHKQTLRNKKEKVDLGISVITASLGFLTNFEDIYKLWAFVSKFLDADFVEKERWRYMALNQTTVEV